MTVRLDGVTRRYGGVVALDAVTTSFAEQAVHGLLGRNGAGKSTLLQLIAGQSRATAGRVEVFGRDPFEDATAMSDVCLVRESQRYPDGYRVRHVLRAAALLLPRWDAAYAAQLAAEFHLPADRAVAKLSRGMLSAVGVVVGLVSRAPLTLFDEPYLGLDAVSRQLFYDRLLADLAEHPRTVILSTHLIDEVAGLLDHVVVLDHGRVVADADADALRQEAVTVTGPAPEVERAVSGAQVLAWERLGGVARATARALDVPTGSGLSVEPVSLQRLVVHLTAESLPPDQAPTRPQEVSR
jgi:ABC-2 type transport system ATP-binding protein